MGLVYNLRLTLYYVILTIVGFLATFIAIVATLFGKRFNTNYYVARTFYHIAGPIVGWNFDVQGEEHLWRLEESRQSAVLLGNHQK